MFHYYIIIYQTTKFSSESVYPSWVSISRKLSQNKSTSFLLAQSDKTPSKLRCNYCISSHSIYKGYSFLAKTSTERLDIAKRNNFWLFIHPMKFRLSALNTHVTYLRKQHFLLHYTDISSPDLKNQSSGFRNSSI